MSASRILIVEDEVKLATVLRDYLVQSGHYVDMLHRGDEVLPFMADQQIDLLVLDLMLPGMDGFDVCRQLRSTSNIPIIITTARVDEIDRILGLELGADDYVCKPYSPREVVARVKTILRRVQQATMPTNPALKTDSATLTVNFGETSLMLTAVEFSLFKTLVDHPGHIFSRDQLMSAIYKDHRVVSDRTIDSHIKKLRKRLSELTDSADFIQSVYGVGYKFEPFPS